MIFSILQQALIMLPLAIGAYLTLSLLKLPDFSLESAYLFGAVAAFLAQGLPLPFVVLSALCGGMIVGTTVSFLNQILHIPFLLAAIVTNGLYHGLIQCFLGTSMASFHPNFPINELGLLIGITVTLFTIFCFGIHSQLGYSLAIYGNNPLILQQLSDIRTLCCLFWGYFRTWICRNQRLSICTVQWIRGSHNEFWYCFTLLDRDYGRKAVVINPSSPKHLGAPRRRHCLFSHTTILASHWAESQVFQYLSSRLYPCHLVFWQ